MTQKLLCQLFGTIWKRWLWDSFSGTHDKVIRVKGWRTAIVQSSYCRKTITVMFSFPP